MQRNDASAAFLTTDLTDSSAAEHPAGQIALGAAGRLGLRSRILSAADGNTGYTLDLPFTTMTAPF
ncbi:hypothetical protein [Streptomyces sp. ITFR-6]|uniref:hypothetical protein n=1 Tax=Streptomyces sp. ITFR-6 TaxID=3075197 RepID=UPI002889365A|nr:hypothetical protein [Streptomyces sp. ITFR-6]WNI31825.1 hypothetical protein RLT59_25845 [Streptomyces sp. ITFR-6]